jgi:nitrilase
VTYPNAARKMIRIACAHLAPVFLDNSATTNKAVAAVREAASAGASLIAFPESFVPGFPVWTALRAPIYNHELFAQFVENSVYIDGPQITAIQDAARRHGITVSIGFSERNHASVGSVWNSNIVIDPAGKIANHHRKIVPTFYEKLIWTPGDGHGLRVIDTPAGRLGVLICGENTNPLARYALMAEAEQIHVSSYPPVWPSRDSAEDAKPYNLENAIRIRAGAHAFEAKVFNLVVSAALDASTCEVVASLGEEPLRILETAAHGVSLVVDPFGDVISDVLRDDEGLLITDIDLESCIEPKQFHDLSGSYNRFDIFQLTVDRRRQQPIVFSHEDSRTEHNQTEVANSD